MDEQGEFRKTEEEKKMMNQQINSAKLKVVFILNLSFYLLYYFKL